MSLTSKCRAISFMFGMGWAVLAVAGDCPTDVAGFTELQQSIASTAQPPSYESVFHGYGSADDSLFQKMTTCFPDPKKVPACLKRAYDLTVQTAASRRTNLTEVKVDNEINMRRPPEEFFAKDANNQPMPDTYQLFQNTPYKDAETIAKENGWPYVRYKSRHSGGFDPGTASLLMIRVPGEKRVPPVDYDQYINIALPPDPEDTSTTIASDRVKPVPRAAIPGPADYEAEAAGQKKNPRVFTIMTVKKASEDQPASVFFNLFQRDGGTTFRPIAQDAVRSCYSCHPNGMRAISPLGFHVNESQAGGGQTMDGDMWKRVQEMNASMNLNQKFRMPDFGKVRDSANHQYPLLNPSGFGPVYGPVRPLDHKVVTGPDGKKFVEYPTRTQKFILGDDGNSGCAKSNTSIAVRDIFNRAPGRDNLYTMKSGLPIDWQKVKKAMNCASCHNNQVHGALNNFIDPETLAFKILVDQSMPVGAHQNPLDQGDTSGTHVHDNLNLNERIALLNCLKAEFQNELQHQGDWVKEVSCKPAVAASGTTTATTTSGDGEEEHLAPAETVHGTVTPAN